MYDYDNLRSMHNRCIQIMLIEMAARNLNNEQYIPYIAEATQCFGLKTEADFLKYFEDVKEMHDFCNGLIRKNYWVRAMALFGDYLENHPGPNPYIQIAAKYKLPDNRSKNRSKIA